MTHFVGTPAFDKLPPSIPVFVLPGILLLPGGQLPLHLFEERYRDLARDAVAADRMIGIMQPRDPNHSEWAPTLYRTGCLGRVVAFRESEDSRYYITLTGVCRFDIARELTSETLYRRVEVDYARFADDMAEDRDDVTGLIDRATFMPSLKSFLSQFDVNIDWSALDKVDDAPLIRSLAMTCPFEPSEKQAILEAQTPADRARLISALVQMSVADTGDDEDRKLQ
ncbi:MAG: LON peptidase substrate-binding domain-containing protein [Proteobacteria bacterium]|nr:LON peptidase substrate-binding domain-containing protein [Pseudomonadota bacterium]MDA1057897.1 LON peptidase substrate-binding domain-containing protein [Pseudomonadota bacterium]